MERDSKGRFIKGHSKSCFHTDKQLEEYKNRMIGNKNSIGNIPWNKGKTNVYTEETLEKLRTSHIGKNGFWKDKERPEIGGKNHYRWKGGITPKNMSIRRSLKYRIWRRDIFIRDEFTCTECSKKHTYIVAHHIKSFADYPELRFDLKNGTTLCKDCHKKTHNYGKRN